MLHSTAVGRCGPVSYAPSLPPRPATLSCRYVALLRYILTAMGYPYFRAWKGIPAMSIQAKLTSKGQVTIPKSVREALDLNQGDSLLFRVENSTAVISKEPGLLDLAGSVPVPPEKRGMQWKDIRAEAHESLGRRYRR